MRSRASWLAWSLCALSLGSAAGALLLGVLSIPISQPDRADLWFFLAFVTVAILSFATVGALVASRRREHPIGWLFCAAGLNLGVVILAGQYVGYAMLAQTDPRPDVAVASWLYGWLPWPLQFLTGPLLLLLFPDGRLSSPRWRPVLWLSTGGLALLTLGNALKPGPLEERYPDLSNPFGVTAAADLLQTGREVGGALFALGLLAAAASLLLRLRVAKGEQRQQLKWFVYVAAVMAAGFGGEILLKPLLGPAAEAGFMIGILALAVLPIAVGIAVLRYRLYEIDRLINRTLVYAALTAGLASVYWATVAVLEQFLRPLTQGSELAVIGSTLAVAALFRPARRWIQDSVDRRFYRRRYDTTRTLEAFGARLRDEVDLGNLSVELLAVVRGTVQPAHASLWLRPTERRAAPDAPPQAAPSNQSA